MNRSETSFPLPSVTCVYLVKDWATNETYVGKTKNLRSRWAVHRCHNSPANELMNRETADIQWIECSHDEARELEALIHDMAESPVNKYKPRNFKEGLSGAEYLREWRGNFTEEQRLARNKYHREYYQKNKHIEK